jgi:predicted DCC family thiol-disulfide oxidoreductase YuxK
MVTNDSILVYDGYCNLCGAIVRFVKKHDRTCRFRYVPVQSEDGREIAAAAGVELGRASTVILVYNSVYLTRSDAALMVFRQLGGRWMIMYAFIILPRFIRDAVYRLIAATRYRLFGGSDTCYIP